MDNYSKYQKYKFKYLKLKNQMGGGKVDDIITNYTNTFTKKPLDVNSIKDYIFKLNINSVRECILLENCGKDNDLYHNIFYTVYYIINNLPENDSTKTTIMTYIYYIVLSISMLFWASCNKTLKQVLIEGMKKKLPEAKIKDIYTYIYNIKDFATNVIKPYFEAYPRKKLMVKKDLLISKFKMKINILVLIDIFEKIFKDTELTFEHMFQDKNLQYVPYQNLQEQHGFVIRPIPTPQRRNAIVGPHPKL